MLKLIPVYFKFFILRDLSFLFNSEIQSVMCEVVTDTSATIIVIMYDAF